MAQGTKTRTLTFVIFLAFVGFISLGLPDGLLSVAGPSIRDTFKISLEQFSLVFITGTAGYFLSSISSGRLVAWLGVGRLLALSCVATATALIGYTVAPGWWGVILLGLLSGAGAGAIDTGLNAYVAANHSEGLMQWLHASFGVGTTIGPLIMTTVLAQELSWKWGYIIVGVAQLALATCFFLTATLWRGNPDSQHADLTEYKTAARETLRLPDAWLGIILFFFYTGLEYGAGIWSYTLFTESRGISLETAGLWVSIYWGVFTIGRITAGILAGRIGLFMLLRYSTIGSMIGAIILWWNPFPIAGLFGLALLGFSLAPIFPGMISTTPQRVGLAHTANTIGFQVGAASIGIGIVPGIAGFLAERSSIEVLGPYLLVLSVVIFGLHELILARRANMPQQNLANLEIGA